jgi:hypothetical protein
MSDIKLMIREIKDDANELNYVDRIHVLQILIQHLHLNKIIEHADGCRVNLDTLGPEIINKLHHIIKTRLVTGKRHEI